MSSNLYKAGWVTVNNDARVINSNELAEQKLRNVIIPRTQYLDREEAAEDGFSSGLEAEAVDTLVLADGEEAVLKSASIEEQAALAAELEQMQGKLENLKAQAAHILEDAQEQALRRQSEIFEEAQNQGYQEGYAQGMAEADALKNEYEIRKKQLEQEYQAQIEELEPEFIETITGIYERIFKTDLSDYSQLVLNLLTDTMQKTEDGRSYIVHVCREDYPVVFERREWLLEETGTPEDRLEIISDMTLPRGGCMIETQSGIYDCSLGTELEELRRKLMLLSYKKN